MELTLLFTTPLRISLILEFVTTILLGKAINFQSLIMKLALLLFQTNIIAQEACTTRMVQIPQFQNQKSQRPKFNGTGQNLLNLSNSSPTYNAINKMQLSRTPLSLLIKMSALSQLLTSPGFNGVKMLSLV